MISEYQQSAVNGGAPFPQPRHEVRNDQEGQYCTLYNILRIGSVHTSLSLMEAIKPTGYSKYVHDFSLAFHLASISAAMKGWPALSRVEERTIIDGYVSQLLSGGHWEWAVYVSMCTLRPTQRSVEESWRGEQAKAIVLRYYEKETEGSQMLRRIGIHDKWFEEALAFRSFTAGNSPAYLNHMIRVSPEKARESLERTLVPLSLIHI